MPVRFLSDAELARLSGWPDEVAPDDLVTFFSLTEDDVAWLRAGHRPENHLGVAGAVVLAALVGVGARRPVRLPRSPHLPWTWMLIPLMPVS